MNKWLAIGLALLCVSNFAQAGKVEEERPATYPDSWNVIYDDAAPLLISPQLPIPYDGQDDGLYRKPYWAERYHGFKPGTTVYPKGYQTHVGGPKLKVDLRKDQDVPVTLRDGTVLYADIFRAADTPKDAKLPAILSWSIYGKSTPKNVISYKRYFINVPPELTSGFAEVEGPDPAYWSQYGYAVINIDQRGVNKSGGDINWWGMVTSYDAHDVINWIAEQPWSNGKVGLSGVSYYGVQQWYTASSNPPEALAAIAPRAHWHDTFRQFLRGGGISNTALIKSIDTAVMGENRAEQMGLMADRDKVMNDYWRDKDAKVEDITIPVYQVAGPNITSSTTFPLLPEGQKWLRFAPTYHLSDYYTEAALATERRFFDRYLKGIDNGWEKEMPLVRIEVTEGGFGSEVVKVREAKSWPIEDTKYEKLYLNLAKGELVAKAPKKEREVSYDGASEKTSLIYTFDEETEVSGFLKAKLWVKSDGSNDMDIFVQAKKIPAAPMKSSKTADLYKQTMSEKGANEVMVGSGQLRVSLRELDENRSTDWLPALSLRKHQFLSPGEVVPVEISLRAAALIFKPGDKLRLDIGGTTFAAPIGTDASNKGNHVIVSGGKKDAYLQIPLPPATNSNR